ncbi:hypothetical protein [Glaciecola sp. MF2-115]|uniref:hypothetical protein n=1 Tax=Glaciecola sp. MF2-115 TaxID=3384827 RepID=UPI00399F6962
MLNIHIFIATNKGLVAIQNITDLQDNALQSVITINGSTDLATVSPAYHRFVQKSTGLIQLEFGGDSFRANISRNIDQGMSWQLPFYLAHLIKAEEVASAVHSTVQMPSNDSARNDSTNSSKQDTNITSTISLGQGQPLPGDVVLIATGQINTSSGAIEAVTHLPEKCITASAQIRLWMKKGILVEFFVPASSEVNSGVSKANKAQMLKLLPDLDCAIYPVIDTQQLKEHLLQLLPVQNSERGQNKEMPLESIDALTAPLETHKSHADDKSQIVILLEKTKRHKNLIIVLLALIFTWFMLERFVLTGTSNEQMRFISTIKSGQHCDANASSQVIRVGDQYVTRVPSVSLASSCSMTLITHEKTPQVWLVADTKTLIELSAIEINKERHWTIPLPQKQFVNREYLLIVTEHYLDLADLAAFKSYLSRLESTQKPSVELVAAFFTQIDVNPQYVSQQLLVAESP